MKKYFGYIFVVLAFFIIAPVQAQNGNIYVCITQRNNPDVSYFIIMRDTAAFGLLLPFEANIVFYSESSFNGGLYTINPDAHTGGYRTLENLAFVHSGNLLPVGLSCQSNASQLEIDISSMVSSVPLPVSTNHAVIVSNEFAVLDLTQPEIFGAALISFDGAVPFNLQLLQVSATVPTLDMRFPFIEANTSFVIVANKSFSYVLSVFSNGNEIPDNRQNAAERQFLISQLQSLRAVNLFDLLTNTQARIYPDSGANNSYLGGFLRLEFGAGRAERRPAFAEGVIVNPIDQIELPYSPVDRHLEAQGLMRPENGFVVARVEANGDLTVRDNQGNEYYVPAWLVIAE